MATIDIKLPKLGESVAEATIIHWLNNPGDFIKKDETLAEVATDKVDTDLPSEYEGTLSEILVKEGETIAVGEVIARITTRTEETLPQKEAFTETEPLKTTPQVHTNGHNGKVETIREKATQLQKESPTFLTPVVRNIAAEAGLSPADLQNIQPTGSNQTRITKKDILNFLAPKQKTPALPKAKKSTLSITEHDEVVSLSRMRKLIGQHMAEAVQTVPHVTTFVRVDVTDLANWRDENKERMLEREKIKITYTHLMMKCIIESLRLYPKLNAWMNGNDELIVKQAVNLGFAAATADDNLIVPNVKNAQDLSLTGLAKQVNRLGKAAKEKQLQSDDIEQTTFTVSNTGMFGSLMGTPILSPPQVGILALGEIESAPGVVTVEGVEQLAIRKQMYLSISYDHRIIDGKYASQFLSEVKRKMQSDFS